MKGVILVTGASSGIGRSIAEHLAKHGWQVWHRSPAASTTPQVFEMLPLDVRDPASIQRCVQAVIDRAGRIDVLVNNAGIDGVTAASEETSIDQLRAVFETNFFGVVQLTNAVLPLMRAQNSGRIINVSSIAGYVAAPPFFSAYTASKHALEGYTETLRYEVKAFNIQVSLVEPGYMRTGIGQSRELPALPLEAYAARRARVFDLDMKSIEWGRDPVIVAQTVERIITARRPALRYPVSSEAVLMALVKRLLPFGLIEWFFSWLFLNGDWQADSPGFLRRLFLDTQLSDRATVYLLAAAGLCVLAGVLLRLAAGQ